MIPNPRSKNRTLEQRARDSEWQRRYRLAHRLAELHRCEGCGQWLYSHQACDACQAIEAERAQRAREAMGIDPH